MVALTHPIGRMVLGVRQHWLSWTVLATVVGLYLVAGFSLAFADGAPRVAPSRASAAVSPISAARLREPPPAPEPLELKRIAPEDAVAWNASIPVSDLPNPAARPFLLSVASEADRLRSLECLTAAVYYEAAIEGDEGQRAVAQVVLNRVRHPAYPRTVCGVVFEGSERATGCQFTFTCDGSLRRTPSAAGWARARKIAEAALSGSIYAPVGWATHYHTNWVVPYWASSLVKAANVGSHIFYRWTGGWGRGPAFNRRHSGTEPALTWLRGRTDPAEETEQLAESVDAAAAAAAAVGSPAAGAAPATASVESFQRAVVRRYEPLRSDTAGAVIKDRMASEASTSQRWAMTGEPAAAAQAPLGRRAAPAELAGVRRGGSAPSATAPGRPPAAPVQCPPSDPGAPSC